ncbi:MAG: Gfo/Idh/MocA family oxidoreductase [Betaproteobacteria bacterium]|nr:Gfo/Idh/MocA family oxidoreductase [Betaproteobacteria bacterium]
MKRKIAIAGLGEAARHIHIPAYAKLDDLEVVGGYDPAIREGGFAFPLFSSIDELLDKTSPDILSAVTPTAHHYEITRKGLLAGCHVLCEKPFMASMEDANEITALSREKHRWVVVNNQYRFMNIHSSAKKVIGTPEFGDLLFISANQTFLVSEKTEAGWRGQETRRTCQEFGIHALDLCRFFFDEDPVSVYARMPKGGNPNGPDYLNLIRLEFSGDRVAHISLDRLCRGPHRYLEMRLDGSSGCVETSIGGNIALSAGVRGGSRKPYVNLDVTLGGRALLYQGENVRKIASDPLDLFAHGTAQLMRAFLDALDQGATPPCNADDNRRTLALMLAAYDSHEQKKTIEMQY